MIVTMMLMLEMKRKKVNLHLILWYQWRRMKTPVEMEEPFVLMLIYLSSSLDHWPFCLFM
jgi:hypothetical protein